MSDAADIGATRHFSILEAATGIFLRYGFKKTSMDDIARAAGFSRQGLYLYFQTKETLFKAMVAHSLERMRLEARTALAREDLDIEDRLLGTFEAMYSRGVGAKHLDELITTTEELVGPIVSETKEAVTSDVARALRAAGLAARWKKIGISASDLSEHLSITSEGIMQKAKTLAEYLDQMRIAIRLVCRGAPC